jgi:O-acetyl-ADP-ribose deacetylase (regulator of RNase III)
MDAARAHGLRSIAFCCISTGLFGYPPEQAAHVALEAVSAWLAANAGALDLVVFDTFLETDLALYTQHLGKYF